MTPLPGLQFERTELAWRRTVLAIAVGAVLSLRVLPPVLGGWSLALGIGGLGIAVVLWVLASRRHARAAEVFRADAAPAAGRAMPGGALLGVLAAVTAAAALLGLAAALLP